MRPSFISVTLVVVLAIGMVWLNRSLADSQTTIGLDFGKDPPPPTKVASLLNALRALFA